MIKHITIFLIALLLSCKSTPKVNYDQKADHRIVFVGNSYTYYNKLNYITSQIIGLVEKKEVFSIEITSGGYTSHNHYWDLKQDDTPMYKVFIKDSHQGTKWDLLVLQENSKIPGLLDAGAQSSMPDIQFFGRTVAKQTMLLMTWAYVDGDPENKKFYPNYLAMQKRLTDGTRFLAKKMSTKKNVVRVVPAGLGYQTVYEDLEKEGKDPFAANSLFRQLYVDDGRHPSLAGSYLTACMIASLYTGKSILGVAGKPKGISIEFAKYLRQVATRVLENQKIENQKNGSLAN